MKRERALETASASIEQPPLVRTERPTYFSCQGIETSMSKFNGSKAYLLEGWLRNVEDATVTYCLQTTYAKRLLEDDARESLRSTTHISKWNELNAFLIKEFKPVQTSGSLHRQMSERKKQSGDVLAMMVMGKAINKEEAAIVVYCIRGIIDYERNKAALYGAVTIDEFKKMLICYEEIRNRTHQKN